MSMVTTSNATISAKGVVIYEYDGVIRAQLGSEIPAATITGVLTNAQIKEVEAAKITGQITETQIGPEAVSTPKLKAASVITAKLAAGSVVAEKLAAESVETAKLKALAVTTAKLAAGSVVAEKIAVAELSAITANLGTVTAGIIQGPTIRTGTVGARVSLASTGLQAFNGGGEEVFSFSTSTGNLFIKGELKAGSIVPATTITGLLTNAQIAELAAAKITGQITETQIGAEAISTAKLAAGSVSTAKLAAGSVTAEKVAVAELSALTANLGTITAGTITGALFRTSAANPKVGFDSTGFWSTNEAGTKVIEVTPEGSVSLTEVTGGLLKNYNQITWAGREVIYGEEAEASLSNLVLQAGFSGTRRGKITAKLRKITAPTSEWRELTVARIGSGASQIESDFLQLPTTAKRLVYSGAVSSAGAILNGTGFSVTRTSKGNYTIKLTSALNTAGSLFVEVNGPFTQIHKASGPSTSEWSITINGFNGLGGGTITLEAADENFSFYIIQH